MTHAALAVSDGSEDRRLVDRAKGGDRAAAYALYQRHADRVHRLIFRLCGDAEMANDLLQDAFVRAFEKLGEFRNEAAFGTWLHRIAVNLTLNARRSERRRELRFTSGVDESLPASEVARGDPDLVDAMRVAIDALTEGQRAVFVMHSLEGYTHVEIGEILGISEGTSKGRLFHARARLRESLARFAPESRHG